MFHKIKRSQAWAPIGLVHRNNVSQENVLHDQEKFGLIFFFSFTKQMTLLQLSVVSRKEI